MKNSTFLISLLGLFVSVIAQGQNTEFGFTKPVKLDQAINSTCDESNPVLSSDGRIMFFSRSFCNENTGGETAGQDIWYSEKGADGNWQKASKLKGVLNNRFNNAPAALSEDGKILYLNNVYRSGEKMGGGMSFTTKKSDTLWETPKSIMVKGLHLKKNSFFAYTISKNGKHIVLSRFKKDSTDLEDLFVSHKDEKGNWSEIVNLGETINSVGFETSPFLADDDSTIYFSSNGWGGYGDADIFMSKRLDDTWKNWTRPANIGNVVNTKGFDGNFSMLSNGDAYFVSGDEPSSPGDIYITKRIRPYNFLNVKVLDKKSGKSISNTTITCGLRESKQILSNTVSMDGSLKVKISPEPNKYYFVMHSEGYIAIEEQMDINYQMLNRDTSISFSMTPIEVGQTVRLNHIYFETGKTNLLEESFIELDVLVSVLTDNPSMEILITGHTDNKGKAEANKVLSEGRVKSVDDYLVTKGIDTKRLKYKGMGSTKPVADNKTEEGRAKNRRVEFQILKK